MNIESLMLFFVGSRTNRGRGAPSLLAIERSYVKAVMRAVRWNITHAARVLGIDRRTLQRKLDRWRIFRPGRSR
jgi:transcriptional regulator of acetoin/glycerol metabolism